MNRLAHLLTRRERDVINGMVAGLTDGEIATVMRCTKKSVAVYRFRIRRKLKARTQHHTIVIWLEGEDSQIGKKVKWAAEDLVRAVCKMAMLRLAGR
jgi:DNA-binding CsgD family transcriptional regulator